MTAYLMAGVIPTSVFDATFNYQPTGFSVIPANATQLKGLNAEMSLSRSSIEDSIIH